MKKLLLSLLLVTNTLFAITLADIDLGTHPRAFITQVDIRDSRDNLNPKPLLLTKLNTVTYQYWNASYPYDSIKYSGKIDNWWYTIDYSAIERYESWYDTYINPNDLSVTYVYVNYNGYSINQLTFWKYEAGQKSPFTPNWVYHSGNIHAFKLDNSKNIGSFFIETKITATDGTVKLGNSVSIDRNTK